MKHLKIVLLLILISVSSCNQTKSKDVITEKLEWMQEMHLEDGKLWEANSETTDGIKKMQQIMNSFSDKESIIAYASLKTSLETEFTNIFQKCTMKGESHNQLHSYLKPMIEIFEGLESSDLNICKESFKTMENHLENYSNYFE